MPRPSETLSSFAGKAGSILSGFASSDAKQRARSGGRLLAYQLNTLPEPVMHDYLEFAPPLGDANMDDARLYPSRDAMLHALPKDGVGAEVGTYRGEFAQKIIAACRPTTLHVIDIDFAPFQESEVRAKLGSNRLEMHEGDSSTILRTFGPNYFDWLYIDGDHFYPGVKKDLEASRDVVKPGGYIMCNDYTNWACASAEPWGVARATHELCLEDGFVVTGFALNGAGYHDILLRKPL